MITMDQAVDLCLGHNEFQARASFAILDVRAKIPAATLSFSVQHLHPLPPHPLTHFGPLPTWFTAVPVFPGPFFRDWVSRFTLTWLAYSCSSMSLLEMHVACFRARHTQV